MLNLEQSSYAVIPDAHGQYEKLARVIEACEPNVDKFILLGDLIDGPDSRRTIQLVRSLGNRAMTIVGNHEWVCRNALVTSEDSAVNTWRNKVWPGYEDRMLESYGLNATTDWQLNADQLREVMNENGDLDWMNNLPAYAEMDDIVAVHAGPELNRIWADQAIDLNRVSSDKTRLAEEPDQIFSHKLAAVVDVPASVDERTFVTGHSHFSLPLHKRIAQRRACLGSNLTNSGRLFVWHSADHAIHIY